MSSDEAAEPLGRVLPLAQAPDGIELRHLRAFVTVAEELNFSRAADRLFLSQPALSRQIRGLERQVGCDLLRRSTHRVELTLAGEALLDRARQLLLDVDEAIVATRSVGGEIQGRIARIWEPIYGLTAADDALESLRTLVEELHAQFPIPEVAIRSANASGVHSLVVTPPGGAPVSTLHLHGGGFVMGSAFGYRHFAGALALASGSGVLLPEYRLAPEHPFPAALEDALNAYLWMLDNGVQADQVVVTGDSAGAALAMSLMITLKREKMALPGAVALLCPGAIDVTFGELTDLPADAQPALSLDQLQSFVDSYLAGHPVDDEVVSPLQADLTGLPPLLIQGGTDDVFVGECHRLAERARQHGVDVSLDLYPVETHDFHVFWSFLPEAAAALDRVGEFARGHRSPAELNTARGP